MIWLIRRSLFYLVAGCRLLVVGPQSYRPARRVTAEVMPEIPLGNRPPFQRFTYGSMTIRVWRNWNARGELYFNLDLVREVGKGRTAKSFRPQDLDDVERCLYKVQAWLRDGS